MIRHGKFASALAIGLVCCGPAFAVPGETIAGPVAATNDPKCKVFMVNRTDGTQSMFRARGRKFVTGGGTCPSDYLKGRKISATVVDVTDVDGGIYRCDISNNSCTRR